MSVRLTYEEGGVEQKLALVSPPLGLLRHCGSLVELNYTLPSLAKQPSSASQSASHRTPCVEDKLLANIYTEASKILAPFPPPGTATIFYREISVLACPNILVPRLPGIPEPHVSFPRLGNVISSRIYVRVIINDARPESLVLNEALCGLSDMMIV